MFTATFSSTFFFRLPFTHLPSQQAVYWEMGRDEGRVSGEREWGAVANRASMWRVYETTDARVLIGNQQGPDRAPRPDRLNGPVSNLGQSDVPKTAPIEAHQSEDRRETKRSNGIPRQSGTPAKPPLVSSPTATTCGCNHQHEKNAHDFNRITNRGRRTFVANARFDKWTGLNRVCCDVAGNEGRRDPLRW